MEVELENPAVPAEEEDEKTEESTMDLKELSDKDLETLARATRAKSNPKIIKELVAAALGGVAAFVGMEYLNSYIVGQLSGTPSQMVMYTGILAAVEIAAAGGLMYYAMRHAKTSFVEEVLDAAAVGVLLSGVSAFLRQLVPFLGGPSLAAPAAVLPGAPAPGVIAPAGRTVSV